MSHPVDVHVGKCIRHRRMHVGMTQKELAKGIGIQFQQIQKYEIGANRISASRLWEVADIPKAPVSYFFEGLAREPTVKLKHACVPAYPLACKEALDLLRFYKSMPENQRSILLAFARDLS